MRNHQIAKPATARTSTATPTKVGSCHRRWGGVGSTAAGATGVRAGAGSVMGSSSVIGPPVAFRSGSRLAQAPEEPFAEPLPVPPPKPPKRPPPAAPAGTSAIDRAVTALDPELLPVAGTTRTFMPDARSVTEPLTVLLTVVDGVTVTLTS